MTIIKQNMRINNLFPVIGKIYKNSSERSSIYKTLREVLKLRKTINVDNTVGALVKEYERIFDYFIDNYSLEDSGQHVTSLNKIYDLCTRSPQDLVMSYSLHDDDDEDEDDEDYTDDDTVIIDETDDNEEEDEKSVEHTDDDEQVEIILDTLTSHEHEEQHIKTRFLLAANLMLTFANCVLTGFTLYRFALK